MRLIMPCMKCTKEHGISEDDLLFVEIHDDSYYDCVCPRGHRSTIFMTTPKFEILFEFGAMALIDGYTREAVSSFAVSLERFYEYWIRVQLLHNKINHDTLDASWKQVSVQSERQLGAFIALFIREYGLLAPLLPQSTIELRNKVTHKGYIPTHQEALNYGDQVLQYMSCLYRQLYDTRYGGISKLEGIELGRAVSRAPELTATMADATVFSEAVKPTGCHLQDALIYLEGRKNRIYKI